MGKKIRNIIILSLIFICIDQFIKIVLTNKMILNQSIVIIKNFFSIMLVHNTGAAFSILNGNRLFLIIIGLIAIVALILYIKKQNNISDINVLLYSLLFSGIIGNLIDRIAYGYVIDYLSFNFGSYYFPIFNFADICIVISVIIILLNMIREDLCK